MFGLLHNPQRILNLYSGYGIAGLGIRSVLNRHELSGIVVGIDSRAEMNYYFQILNSLSNKENRMKYHHIIEDVKRLKESFWGNISSNFDFVLASPEPGDYDSTFDLMKHLYQRYGCPCVIEYRKQPEFWDVLLCGYQFKYNKPYHRFYEIMGFDIPEATHPCKSPVERKDLVFGLPKHYQELSEDIWETYLYPSEYLGYLYEQYIKHIMNDT